MNNTQPIGIIDSGSGGLSIWQSIREVCPNESIIYIGDHKYVPYGSKSAAFIVLRVKRIIAYLLKNYSCKLIIIACNSATVAGIGKYRKKFPKIPIVGVVPVIKTASEVTKTGAIAVLATPFTTRSVYQRELIKRFADGKKVYAIGCPMLVSYIEKGVTEGPVIQKILKKELRNIPISHIDAVALGCTHYPFIKDEMAKILGPHVRLLDSGGAVARQTIRIIEADRIASTAKTIHDVFITSGDKQKISKIATILTHTPIVFEHISIP